MLTNGTEVAFVKQPDGSYKADLGLKEITPGEMVLKGGVRPTGTVAEGEKIPAGGIGAKVSVKVELAGFASATVELPEGYELASEVTIMVNSQKQCISLLKCIMMVKVVVKRIQGKVLNISN